MLRLKPDRLVEGVDGLFAAIEFRQRNPTMTMGIRIRRL